MNPKEMTTEQLESLGYRLILQQEQIQVNLRAIHAEIQSRTPVSTPPITEVKG